MIRQSHDVDADALYVELTEEQVAHTVEFDAGTLVDLGVDGRPVGIEIIHPAREWPLGAIIARFGVPEGQAAELRAYFPRPPEARMPENYPAPMHPRTPAQSPYPGLALRIAVG